MSTYSNQLTLKMIEDLIDSWANSEPCDFKLELPASDYNSLTDEEFKAFVSDKTHKFYGGWDAVQRMMARCKRLGIETDNNETEA